MDIGLKIGIQQVNETLSFHFIGSTNNKYTYMHMHVFDSCVWINAHMHACMHICMYAYVDVYEIEVDSATN